MKKILLVLMLFPLIAFAQIYKWTDENGKVHFSDKPIKENSETVEVKVNKVGSMISPSTKARMLASQPSYVNNLPAPSSGSSKGSNRACTYSKSLLQEKELKLRQLKKRGYKQYERANAEDAIEVWQQKVKTHCN